jgi:hypothetical protein
MLRHQVKVIYVKRVLDINLTPVRQSLIWFNTCVNIPTVQKVSFGTYCTITDVLPWLLAIKLEGEIL